MNMIKFLICRELNNIRKYQIIILFVIHIDAFEVEKLEESTCRTIFPSKSKFGEFGSETFCRHLEALNEFI